jgi:hypothetical protein
MMMMIIIVIIIATITRVAMFPSEPDISLWFQPAELRQVETHNPNIPTGLGARPTSGILSATYLLSAGVSLQGERYYGGGENI